jgi:hypothetical protein
MLVACPECERRVSDRAAACPECGFPVAEHFSAEATAKVRAETIRSRREEGEVDCARCEARGFRLMKEVSGDEERQVFEWCAVCEHSGRVVLGRADDGFYAVARSHLAEFLAGAIDPDGEHVQFLGTEPPLGFRYPNPSPRR